MRLTTDGIGDALAENTFNLDALRSAATITSSAIGAATEYAIDGSASLNVVNMGRMLGITDEKGNELSAGVLQMDLGGGGALFNVGSGGYDVGLDLVATSLEGLSDVVRVTSAKVGGALGTQRGVENRAILNAANTLSYSRDRRDTALAGAVWERRIKSEFDDMAEGEYGRYDSDNPDTIVLSRALTGNDRESSAMLGSAMAHEATHLVERAVLGETTEASAYRRTGETYRNLMDAWGLEGNEAFGQAIVAGLLNPENYRPNEGPMDHFFPELNTAGEYQSDAANWREALGEALSRETVDQINEQRIDDAYNRFLQREAGPNFEGNLSEFESSLSREEFEEFATDPDNRAFVSREYGYEGEVPFVSLGGYGCVLYSALYAANAMTGDDMTGIEANNRLREEGAFSDDTLLTVEESMELLTGDRFNFQEVFEGADVTIDLLNGMDRSTNAFVAHVRLNSTQSGESHHSTMMSGFRLDEDGELIIELMNPYQSPSSHGSDRTEVRLDEINRFDFFIVSPSTPQPAMPWDPLEYSIDWSVPNGVPTVPGY